MEYRLKRGFKPDIERVREVLEEVFPTEVHEEGEMLVISYGALKKVEIKIVEKKLSVITEANPQASEEMMLETNRRFRDFLLKATGYTAKQRIKQAKKDVQE